MLNDKRDETIKRYLSKVGTLDHKSKLYGSRYYKISYEGSDITVRFADHFNSGIKGIPDIDIIKITEFYVVKTIEGLSTTIGGDIVIPYLKSLLITYPEMRKTINSYKKAADEAEKMYKKIYGQMRQLQALMDKKSEEFELADGIWDENKKLLEEKKDLEKTINFLQVKLDNAKISMDTSKKKADAKDKECKKLREKMSKLKDLLYSIQ